MALGGFTKEEVERFYALFQKQYRDVTYQFNCSLRATYTREELLRYRDFVQMVYEIIPSTDTVFPTMEQILKELELEHKPSKRRCLIM